MKRIYFAAPLFNEMELKRNEEYTILLEKWGYEVYLPQREAGLSAQILKDESKDKLEINKRIFNTGNLDSSSFRHLEFCTLYEML